MSERDELAEIIQDVGEYIPGSHAEDYTDPTKAADAIIAAGYRKPRTITLVEELRDIYAGTIIKDADTTVWAIDGGSDQFYPIEEGRGETYQDEDIALPAIVLWEETP